jgi:hypothetical protein
VPRPASTFNVVSISISDPTFHLASTVSPMLKTKPCHYHHNGCHSRLSSTDGSLLFMSESVIPLLLLLSAVVASIVCQ